MTTSRLVLCLRAALLLALASALGVTAQVPNLPWKDDAVFVLDNQLSDEFNGNSLDESKWDSHGDRNPDTGCPKWNGPPSSTNPEYATYYPTSTDPVTKQKNVGSFSVSQGNLNMQILQQPLSFFQAREYYCNGTTFTCNHDPSINCFGTNFFGNPIYKPGTNNTEYLFVVHDKCKKEPFCIPHPEYVTKRPRVYTKFQGVHIASKKLFKYGYVEARVLLDTSPAIHALWMSDDNLVDGYCRYRKGNEAAGEFRRVLECPSRIRSRRWQEIDMLEAMNSVLFRRKYVPNIHCFTGYKGEFTSKEAEDRGAGNMGGGPIVATNEVFRESKPNFTDVANPQRNDFHLNVGSVYELPTDWAAQYSTVGMYWSPKEIRFYYNGQEVKRFQNWLIHQPLRLDISKSWNINWAKQAPTEQEIGLVGKVDYLRTYKVYTNDGNEPRSALPLLKTMRERFLNNYGTKLGGMYNRFPVNDDDTVVPGIPTADDQVSGAASRMQLVGLDEGADGSDAGNNETMSWKEGNVQVRKLRNGDMIKEVEIPSWVRQGSGLAFGNPSGAGNTRVGGSQKKMNGWLRRVAESREDRRQKVDENGISIGSMSEQTFTEFRNPNGNQAGWEADNGDGIF